MVDVKVRREKPLDFSGGKSATALQSAPDSCSAGPAVSLQVVHPNRVATRRASSLPEGPIHPHLESSRSARM